MALSLAPSWKQAAGIEWDGDGSDGARIFVEPFQRGIGWAVVHELAHYVMRVDAEKWGELEEPMIEGLATEVWKRIESSPRRYWWWRRAVEAKLKGVI